MLKNYMKIAKTNMSLNIARSWQTVSPELQENIKALLALSDRAIFKSRS